MKLHSNLTTVGLIIYRKRKYNDQRNILNGNHAPKLPMPFTPEEVRLLCSLTDRLEVEMGTRMYKDGSRYRGLFAHFFMQPLG